MIRLRDASPEDFRAYAGRDPDPTWHVDWAGKLVERDGEVIGIGVVSEDPYGRLWAWTHSREPLPAIVVHRNTKAMLAKLRRAGADAVHCYRNEDIPGSERWLRRLGFVPAPELGDEGGKMVWRCTLSI